MSTKLSTDLHITRPTTRLHAPPGGATSFSFGDTTPAPAVGHNPRNVPGGKDTLTFGDPHSTTPPPTPSKAVAAAAPERSLEEEFKALTIVPTTTHTVALVVAGTVGIDAVVTSTVNALAKQGITGAHVAVSRVADPSILPYVVKRAAKENSFQVIVAIAVLSGEALSHLEQSLVSSLLNLGVTSEVPVIPAAVKPESLLELKALLPIFSASWANSASLLLNPVVFESAREVETAAATARPVVDAATVSTTVLLDNFRESLKSHGASGITGIGRKFRIADDDRSGTISLAEFRKVVSEHALGWSPTQEKAVFDHFDRDKNGSLVYDEFLFGLRGPLNERRSQLVLQAFEILDSDKSGVVELNDILAKYDGTKHPDVIAGKRTNEEVLREFMDTFDANHDGKVTPHEFLEYYANVSSSIDDDDYFELMIRNAWHISGGQGWCANSSCRRVLVTHTDGHQTVEEVKNDIGIQAGDKAKILANLAAQGINDVASIDTKGGVDAETPAVDAEKSRPATAPASSNPRRAKGGASSIVLG